MNVYGPGGELDIDWPQCIGLPLGGVEINCEILAIASSQDVVAGSAAKRVVAASARQRIAARIPQKEIVAIAAGQSVVLTAADETDRRAAADQIECPRAGQRVQQRVGPVWILRSLNDSRVPGLRTDAHAGEIDERRRGVGQFVNGGDDPAGWMERAVIGKAIAIENELAIGAGIDDRELRRCAARLNSPGSHLLRWDRRQD